MPARIIPDLSAKDLSNPFLLRRSLENVLLRLTEFEQEYRAILDDFKGKDFAHLAADCLRRFEMDMRKAASYALYLAYQERRRFIRSKGRRGRFESTIARQKTSRSVSHHGPSWA